MSSSGQGPSWLDLVFGADNVARLLAELETEEQRTAAKDSLVCEANARLRDQPFRSVSASSTAFLRNLLVRFRGPDAAARVEFAEDHAVHAPPTLQHQQPFDATQAAQGVVQGAGADEVAVDSETRRQEAAAARAARKDKLTPKKPGMMLRLTEAADKTRKRMQQRRGGMELPQAAPYPQPKAQQFAAAGVEAFANVPAGLQDMIDEFRFAAHDGQAEQYGSMGLTGDQDMTMMQQDEFMEEQFRQPLDAAAQGVDEVAVEQEEQQQDAAAARTTTLMLQMALRQQMTMEQYGAMGLTGGQDMTMMQQQQQQHLHDQAQQYADMDLDVTLGHGHPNLQQQQAAAYADAVPGGSSSSNAPPHFVQQPPPSQTAAELEASMPPLSPSWLASLASGQLPNYGGDEGESSSDPGVHCSSSTPYPDAPSDDK